MVRGRFNPPPSWPVPRGWTPPPDWEPDPHWAPAPIGWQFWIDEAYPESEELPRRRHPADTESGAPGLGGSRRTWLLAGAAVLVVALVAGTVAAVMWWRHPDEPAARPDKMLAGTFPTRPEWAWFNQAQSLAPGSEANLRTPVGPVFVQDPGALVAGGHVLVHAANGSSGGVLIALSMANGHTEWSVPFATATNGPTDGCAAGLLGNTLPCIASGSSDAADIAFIDVDSGKTVATSHAPFNVDLLATNGNDLYTIGHARGGSGTLVTKGTRDDPGGQWKTVVPQGECGVGYNAPQSPSLRIRHGIVVGEGEGAEGAVLRDADGSALFDHDVTAPTIADDGSRIVAHRCQPNPNYATTSTPANTEVSDNTGHQLFGTQAALQTYAMQVYRAGPPPYLSTDGDGLNPSTGQQLWHVGSVGPDPMLIGKTLITDGEAGLSAYDVNSGQPMWHYPDAPDGIRAVTDGQHLLATNRFGGVDAIELADGHLDWSAAAPTSDVPQLYATEAGLLVVTKTTIGLMHPTGGPTAGVPDLTGNTGQNANANPGSGGGTRLVTKCGRTPHFEPEDVRTDSGALVVKMKIVAQCPGGDVLNGAHTAITVTSNGQNVAAGNFDLSAQPLVVPPAGDGSSDPSVEHEFRFPLGTFWRLPVSVNEVPSTGATQQGAVDMDVTTLVVACQETGSSGTGAPAAGAAQSNTAAGPATPASGDDESASFDALRALANADRPFVAAQLADRWVPQLSSKRPGLVADGITWHNADTLREHLQLRLANPEVRLLWSGDWSTFSAPDFWVTIAGVTFGDADGALGWCRSRGFDRDHCYAKLVSTTHPVDGSTAFNP